MKKKVKANQPISKILALKWWNPLVYVAIIVSLPINLLIDTLTSLSNWWRTVKSIIEDLEW